MGDEILGDYLFNSTDYSSGTGTTIFDSNTFSGNDIDLTLTNGGFGSWSTSNVASKGSSFSAYNGSFSYNCNNSGYWMSSESSGTNYVNEGESTSVCMWFNTLGTSPDSKHDSIYASTSNTNNEGFQITAKKNNSGDNWVLRGLDGTVSDKIIKSYVNTSGWQFISIIFDKDNNKNCKIYWANVGENTLSVPFNANLSTNEFKMTKTTRIKLGTNRNAPGNGTNIWNGSIGPTRVYSGRVLSQQEIENIFLYNSISGEAGAFGDPHIKTIQNINYKFDYLGSFRLFDNNDKNKRIIINGESNFGLGRWRKKQYIRKIYIKYCDKEMLIDTGFRGHKVKIVENNGIKYDEFDLAFSHEAYNYCFYCKTKFSLDFDIHKHKTDIHQMFIPVRNKIIVDLDNFKLEITNVNRFNLQPCRIFLIPKIPLNKKWSGCLVDKKFAYKSKLDKLKQISDCIEEKVEIENEKLPSSINYQWE